MVDPVVLLSRFLHVLAAIVLVGGAVFTRQILFPATAELPDEPHQKLKAGVTKRWKIAVHTGITLLLVTGFYNFIAVAIPQHRGDSQYHMWMGIKIVLAFVIFFIASVLPGRTAAFEGMRRKSKFWLGTTIVLSLIVILIASGLKVRGTPPRVLKIDEVTETIDLPASKPVTAPEAGSTGSP